MRVRRIAARILRPGATVDGEVLLEADLRYQIDNMENPVAARAGGETIIALVSDNNQNKLQRTLLLFFALAEERDSTARPVDQPGG